VHNHTIISFDSIQAGDARTRCLCPRRRRQSSISQHNKNCDFFHNDVFN